MTMINDFGQEYRVRPIYIGQHYRVERVHRQSTWRERVAIGVCQVLIPAGLLVGALLSLALMLAGSYLLFAVGVAILRRLGGY